MTIQISVRDFRGVERADVELAPIALVGGQNEQGKSSLAQAARAALAGVAIPIPGVAKKDARLLVRDGAEEGSAEVRDAHGSIVVSWPKAEVRETGDVLPAASSFSVGLRHLFDLDDKERANVLAGYIDGTPSVADLGAAMRDAGYSDKAVDQVWKAVGTDGWDGTYKKAREHGTKLKGQWEGVTGEKYGSKKAESWFPKHWGTQAQKWIREDLEANLEAARARVKAAVGTAAVSKAEIERLQAEASAEVQDPEPLRKELAEAREKLPEIEAERKALPADQEPPETLHCPECSTVLVVEKLWQGPTVLKRHEEQTNESTAEKKARQKLKAQLDGQVANLNGKISTLTQQIAQLEQKAGSVVAAKRQLAEVGEPSEDNSEAVAEAEQAEASARSKLEAFDAKAQADKTHTDIAKNDRLAEILAPDGLRRRKLAAGLDTLNRYLSELCAAAKWPAVRLDENLQAHYGTRPAWAASTSGQWRARAIMQVAMAQMDGSAAVVIDEADILDARGRNGLFAMLHSAGVRALVAMTINKPALVPNLKAAGMGASFWIESGVCEAIGEKEEQAA